MKRGLPWGIVCVIAWIAVTPNASRLLADPTSSASPKVPHDLKAEALARANARKAVAQAVAALTKEFEAHTNDSTLPLRAKSNYFVDNPSPDITPDAIVRAMEQSDWPRAEACYIKWQLLSGLPAKADDKLAPRIGDLYANAPGPFPNPSLTATDKLQLDGQMLRRGADQESTVNDAWTKNLADWAASNSPILNYNDALFNMLPEGLGALTLGLQDAYQRRAAAGVDCDDFIKEVLSGTRDWAVTASGDDLGAAELQCTRWISVYSKTFPPSVYTSVSWDDHRHQLLWKATSIKCASADTLTAFKKFLTDQANNNANGGGIQIKAGK